VDDKKPEKKCLRFDVPIQLVGIPTVRFFAKFGVRKQIIGAFVASLLDDVCGWARSGYGSSSSSFWVVLRSFSSQYYIDLRSIYWVCIGTDLHHMIFLPGVFRWPIRSRLRSRESSLFHFVSAIPLAAQTDRNFDGGGDGTNWSDAANWEDSQRPDTSSENAIIDGGGAWSVDLDTSYSIGGLTIGTDDQLSILDSSVLSFGGTITNNNAMFLLADSGTDTLMLLTADASLTGGGTITLSQTGGGSTAGISSNSTNRILTKVNNTIEGQGLVGRTNTSNISIINQSAGIFDANVTGQELRVATTGGNTITNSGAFRATNGGYLALSGAFSAGAFDNTGGTISASGSGSEVRMDSNIAISGGTLSTSGGGIFRAVGVQSSAILSDLTIAGDVVVDNFSYLNTSGNINHTSGTIRLDAGTDDALLILVGDTNLTGGGAIDLTQTGAGGTAGISSNTSGAGARTLTNTDNTIQGQGLVGRTNTTNISIINQSGGTFDANVAGQELRINTTGGNTVTNSGTFQATNGGTLALSGQFAAGGFDNTGGTIHADGVGSEVTFDNNLSVTGGTLSTANGGTIEAVTGIGLGTSATLTDVTIDGTVNIGDSKILSISNSLNNVSNTINISADSNDSILQVASDTILTGGGTITLQQTGAGGQATLTSNGQTTNAKTLTNNGNTIQGEGMIGFVSGTSINMVNGVGGTIQANVNGGTLRINPTGANTFINNGVTKAMDGGTLLLTNSFSGGPHTNNGAFEVYNNSSFNASGIDLTNLSGTVLTGGTYLASTSGSDAAAMALPGSGITELGASTTVLLRGQNATIQSGSTNLADTLTTNGGHIILYNHTMNASGFTTNTGRLSTDEGGRLDAGNSSVNNTGIIEGEGAYTLATLFNFGNIKPGIGFGTMDVEGDLVLDAAGNLEIEIGGYDFMTEYDFLDVTGTADLGGTWRSFWIPGSTRMLAMNGSSCTPPTSPRVWLTFLIILTRRCTVTVFPYLTTKCVRPPAVDSMSS
jgi:fibronectin-binding autotransporter adhesin